MTKYSRLRCPVFHNQTLIRGPVQKPFRKNSIKPEIFTTRIRIVFVIWWWIPHHPQKSLLAFHQPNSHFLQLAFLKHTHTPKT
ncbi:hypothetical protein HanRHA438_Chr14g0682061 [Helianthus annuus]|nr:hypothetical protein HanRHA438_Chr14g0682061 [Helianthus annuus]